MAKLDSPFGSKRVSGRIGDGFVMASWHGIPYLRQRVIPAYRTSERLERVRGLFAQQNRRWMELRESEREAWRMFCGRKRLLGQANAVFASYSSLALDAGLPEPILPPRSRMSLPPRLSLAVGPEPNSLVVSWDQVTSHESRVTNHESRVSWTCGSGPGALRLIPIRAFTSTSCIFRFPRESFCSSLRSPVFFRASGPGPPGSSIPSAPASSFPIPATAASPQLP